MFSPQIRPSKLINLWYPFPQPRRGLGNQTFQRGVFIGDVVSITSDGRANVKFNIFHSESENHFYENFPPPGYVAFGPPLESYQQCEEHNIDRPHQGIKGLNSRQIEVTSDQTPKQVSEQLQTVCVIFYSS